MARWDSVYSPCQLCELNKEELKCCDHDWRTPQGPKWPVRSHESFERACKQCEVHVLVTTQSDLRQLCHSTKWVKPKSGVGGRLIWKDITVCGVDLRIGDRLTPTTTLTDIAMLASASLPQLICFWRPRRDNPGRVGSSIIDSVSWANPIFSTRLHCSPGRSLAVDSLHTVQFGPVMRYITCVLWRVLLHNPWKLRGTISEVLETGILHLKGDLEFWQGQPENDVPNGRRIRDLTLKMLHKRGPYNLEDRLFFHKG